MSETWRAIWWGQAGNFIAFVVGLAGIGDRAALIWGVIITFIATVSAG